MNKAVDQVWRKRRIGLPKYFGLEMSSILSDEQRSRVSELTHVYPMVGKAYRLKEQLKEVLNDTSIIHHTQGLQLWLSMVYQSGIKSVQKVAKLMDNNWDEVVNYFKYLKTNAFAERVNLKIQEIKRTAKGFATIPNFMAMIYFHLGQLNLSAMTF